MYNLINRLLLISIFILPLLGATNNLGYEQIKVLFFILSISLISFVWILQKPKIKLSRIGWVSVLFIIILLLTSLLGIDFRGSFLGNIPYYQGLLIYSYLFLFYLIVSNFEIKLKYYALTLTASALIVSSLAIEDWILKNLGYLVPNYAGRVVSTFGQPNFYAGFLLLTLPFSYYLFKDSTKKLSYFGLICGFSLIIGIFVSYSRSTILLALFLLSLALADQLKIKFKKVLITVGIGIILMSLILAFKYSSGIVGNQINIPISTKNPDLTRQSVEQRVYIWPQFIKIAFDQPIFGYGLENINLSFKNYFEKNKHKIFEENLNIEPVLISLKDLTIDRTHNYTLDLLIFSGFSGVIIWLLLIALLIKKCKNIYVLVGFLTYLIWIQFQNQSIIQLIYFWFLVGTIDKPINGQNYISHPILSW